LLSSKVCFFVYCVIQNTVDSTPRRYLYTRMRLSLCLSKVRMVNKYVSNFLQVGHSLQARSQVLRSGFLRGKYILGDNIFVFIIWFKTNVSGHNKIWEGHKKTWGPCPRMSHPWLARGLVLRTKVAFTFTRVKYIAFVGSIRLFGLIDATT